MTLTCFVLRAQLIAVAVTRGGNIGGACPMTEVTSVACGGSKPRDMCLSVCERLIIIVYTCDILSYPNSPTNSGLMEPHTDFASVAWSGGKVWGVAGVAGD